jgi:hypothetical protein
MTCINKVAVSAASVRPKHKKLVLHGSGPQKDIPVGCTLGRPLSHDTYNGGTTQRKRPTELRESQIIAYEQTNRAERGLRNHAFPPRFKISVFPSRRKKMDFPIGA